MSTPNRLSIFLATLATMLSGCLGSNIPGPCKTSSLAEPVPQQRQSEELTIDLRLLLLADFQGVGFVVEDPESKRQPSSPTELLRRFYAKGSAHFAPDELSQVLKVIQQDPRNTVTAASCLVVSDGQSASLELQPDFQVTCRPSLSSDGHTVDLDLKRSRNTQRSQYPETALDRKRAEAIPLGDSVLFGGWTILKEGRVELEPRFNSPIPYVNHLLVRPKQGQELMHLAILATPHIRTNAAATCTAAPEVTIMAWPKDWSDHLGQTVTVEGAAIDCQLGALVQGVGGAIWIDGLDSWPYGFYTGGDDSKHVRVTGTVIKKNDVPVFVQKPGDPPRGGIPVNSEQEAEKLRWRYLLQRATWTVLE